MTARILLLLSLFCVGCTNQVRLENYQPALKRNKVSIPSGLSTDICRGYGCRIVDSITLSSKDWKYVTAPLRSKPRSAQNERDRLRWVIGRFEQVTGKTTGTSADVPGTYWQLGPDQQDCIDESINTTLYLLMLDQHRLLLHHKVGAPAGRFPPHFTAVLIETSSGHPYAMDSWFHYNGVRAETLPLEAWGDGWHPAKENLRREEAPEPKRW